jgi:LacI family transcriptional regulator, galactose operon repressor
MVTIKDVARRAGVSLGTVSNVINRPGAVSHETRSRVLAAIDELGYVRSESARQLRMGQSRIIGLLLLDMGNPFFVDVARGAEHAARAAGLKVMVCNSGEDPREEAEYLSLFAEQRVRGVLVTPADINGRNLDGLVHQGVPFVMVDRVVPATEGCSVSVDDVTGGALAVKHLLDAGYSELAFVNGPTHLTQCADRLEGVRKAIVEAGLPDSAVTVVQVDHLDVASGRDAAARLLGLPRRPQAVFCANDLLALGVLQTVFGAGVRVPQQMAIVGYDDIEFASAAAVPLTSVRQPAWRIGATAAELLIAETGPGADEHTHQRVVFQPELVVRRSSMPTR